MKPWNKKHIYVWLLPTYPILNIYQINFVELTFRTILPLLISTLVFITLAHIFLSYILKNKDKSALIVSIGSFLFFTYTQITQTLVSIFNTDLGSFTHTLYCLSFGSIVFFLYCYASYKLIRSKSVLTKPNEFFHRIVMSNVFSFIKTHRQNVNITT